MTSGNLEPLAREICEIELRAAADFVEADLPKMLDRYWPVIAAEISGNLRDENGNLRPHSASEGLRAWDAWLDEHPKQPAAINPGKV